MTTQTDFDKQLDDILLRHGAEQGELHHSLKEAFKAAVDTYVIGKDEYYGTGTPHRTENKLKMKQRLALWGDK